MGTREQWWFQDLQGKVFGPYKRKNMRVWYEEGRLHEGLPVSCDPAKGFFRISDFYPNTSKPFEFGPIPMKHTDQAMNASTKPPPPVPESVAPHWYFLDQKNDRQGPFTRRQMYEWLAEGYFELSLVVCDNNLPLDMYGWKTIAEYYPNYNQETPFKREPEPPKQELKFPEFVPAPPKFQHAEKLYPSAKKKRLVPLNLMDVFGNRV